MPFLSTKRWPSNIEYDFTVNYILFPQLRTFTVSTGTLKPAFSKQGKSAPGCRIREYSAQSIQLFTGEPCQETVHPEEPTLGQKRMPP